MLAPRWSAEPTSGAGAAKHGGRFNQPGRPALYMSEDFATAVAEYEQDLGIRPGTLCAYAVDVRKVMNLADARILAQLRFTPADLRVAWKHVALIERRRPPTWDLAERLIAAGANGALVPSMRGTDSNLVLWRWNQAGGGTVRVLDPLGDLRLKPERVRRRRTRPT